MILVGMAWILACGRGLHGKTWGKKGQAPVVERPGQRQSSVRPPR